MVSLIKRVPEGGARFKGPGPEFSKIGWKKCLLPVWCSNHFARYPGLLQWMAL